MAQKSNLAERKRVLDLARNGLSDTLLVIALSRWGWSTNYFRATNEDLVSRQLPVRALKAPEIDISTAQGRLMLDSLSAISEFGRDLLQEIVNSATLKPDLGVLTVVELWEDLSST